MQQRIIRLTLVKLFCLRTTSLNTAIYSGISRYTAKILFLRISDYLWHLGAVRLKSTRNLTPKSVSGSITSVAQSIVAHTGLAAISRHPRWFQFILLVLLFFTARSYPMAVYAIVLCPSVCPSITSWSSIKTTKHSVTQTSTANGLVTLFCAKDRGEITMVSPLMGSLWGRLKSAIFDSRHTSEPVHFASLFLFVRGGDGDRRQ